MKIFKEADKTHLIGLLVFLISLGVYIHTLAPSITYEDSGELITTPYILGISHPSGYPFYTIIMKVLMTLLPISNIAFRANLATAVFGSLSVLMVYFIVLKVERDFIGKNKVAGVQNFEPLLNGYVPAVIAALLTSFSSMIWLHSVTTEVYTLNLFLMMLLTYFMLVWDIKRDIRYVFLGSLIYGLSLGNHEEAVLFFPAFIYFLLITDWREILKIKHLISIIMLFGLGLLIYVYLPLRSAKNPYLDWSNAESLRGFLFAVRREQYIGGSEVPRDIIKWVQQLNLFGFFEQVSIWTFFFSFFGLYRLLRKNLKIFITFSLITFCSSIGFIYLVDPPIPTQIFALLRTFYLPLYAMFAIWISFGIAFVIEKIYLYLGKIKPVSSTAWAFILIPFFLMPATSLLDHYEAYDFKGNYFAYDFAANMANSVEEKSVIFTSISIDTFPFWYYRYAEGRRGDLAVVHQKMAALPWYYAQMMQDEPKLVLTRPEFSDWNNDDYLDARSQIITNDIMLNNPEYKFYYTIFTKDFLPKDKPIKYRGILWQDTNEDLDLINGKIWFNYCYRGLGNNKSIRLVRDNEILRQLYSFNINMARKYLKEKKAYLAIYQYQLTNKIFPNSEAYYNLGFLYYEEKMIDSAIREFNEYLKLDPNSPKAQNIRSWMVQFNPQGK
ncbi:MAG: DUF2723 domain-containing protein [bacterium]|nr:DUF2723 domain-containing protein [bacterium]